MAVAGVRSTSRLVFDALESVAHEFEIAPIAGTRERRRKVRTGSAPPVPAGLRLTTRVISPEATATRALSDV
jgi:hypothetical protein